MNRQTERKEMAMKGRKGKEGRKEKEIHYMPNKVPIDPSL